jgi:hypothetical protein
VARSATGPNEQILDAPLQDIVSRESDRVPHPSPFQCFTYNQAGQSTQAKQAAQKALQLKQDFDGAADARRILTQNP